MASLVSWLADHSMPAREFWVLAHHADLNTWPTLCTAFGVPSLPFTQKCALVEWLATAPAHPPAPFWKLLVQSDKFGVDSVCKAFCVTGFPINAAGVPEKKPRTSIRHRGLEESTRAKRPCGVRVSDSDDDWQTDSILTARHINRVLAIEISPGTTEMCILRALGLSGVHVVQWLYTPHQIEEEGLELNVVTDACNGLNTACLVLSNHLACVRVGAWEEITNDVAWSFPFSLKYAVVACLDVAAGVLTSTPRAAERMISRLVALGGPTKFGPVLSTICNTDTIREFGVCCACGQRQPLTYKFCADGCVWRVDQSCARSLRAAAWLRKCIDTNASLSYGVFSAMTILEPVDHNHTDDAEDEGSSQETASLGFDR